MAVRGPKRAHQQTQWASGAARIRCGTCGCHQGRENWPRTEHVAADKSAGRLHLCGSSRRRTFSPCALCWRGSGGGGGTAARRRELGRKLAGVGIHSCAFYTSADFPFCLLRCACNRLLVDVAKRLPHFVRRRLSLKTSVFVFYELSFSFSREGGKEGLCNWGSSQDE